MAVLKLRSVPGLSPWMHGFNPKSVHVGFVVEKVAVGHVFIGVLLFPLSASFHHRSMLIYSSSLIH
jgi:hypothetical protein